MNDHLLSELLEKARYHEDHDLWLHAAQYYHRILAAKPEMQDVVFRLARVYDRMGNIRAAEQLLLNALGRDANNSDILFELAFLFMRNEQADRARYYLEQIIPYGLPRAHYTLALLHLQRGDLHAAERHLARTLELDAVYADTPLILVDVLIRTNQSFRAVSVARDAIANGYDDWRYSFMLGTALANLQRWEEALSAFQSVLDVQRENVDALLAAANVLMQQRNLAAADELLRRALATAPESAPVLTALGTLALLKAEKLKARSYFSRALEIDPTYTQALESMRFFERDRTP